MRGLKKSAPDGAYTHTDGHGDSMTESAHWGQLSENVSKMFKFNFFVFLGLLLSCGKD